MYEFFLNDFIDDLWSEIKKRQIPKNVIHSLRKETLQTELIQMSMILGIELNAIF